MSSVRERLKVLTRDDLVEKFQETTGTLLDLFKEKSEEYDIEFYKEIGGYYLLLRIREKYHRLHNMLLKEGYQSEEPIDETIKDLSTIFTALYSMIEFDLVSIDRLREQYSSAMEVDIDEHIQAIDAKKRKPKKWWQFWKRQLYHSVYIANHLSTRQVICLAEKVPKKPEAYTLYDEEDDNIFFALNVDAEGYESDVELGLIVDVKNNEDDDSMEALYSVFLESDDIDDLIKWLKKAKKYMDYVEENGAPISLILGVEDSYGNVEGE